jgi:phospholipid/cholesterol/gamma-HCH transport system substrate-binding protein
MAVTRAQKARLGVFVAVSAAALLGALALLAGTKLGQKHDRYGVRFSEASQSLSGLEVGAPVKYSGIRVGRVESLAVDPKDVSVLVVTLSLNAGTPVAEDSTAAATSQGITGLKYIELSRGSRTARIRAPGEVIPAGTSAFDQLTDNAAIISQKIDLLVDNLNQLTTPATREKVVQLIDNTNKLLTTAEATLAENRANLRHLTAKVAQATEQVDGLARDLRGTAVRVNDMLEGAQPQVKRALADTAALASELRQSRAELDRALQAAQAALGEEGAGRTVKSVNRLVERSSLVLTQSQEELDATLEHLRETSENLSVFSQRIREDPSLLLRGGEEAGGKESGEK